jgi:hypothetical protein
LIIANKDEYITALAKVYKKANPDLPLNDRTKQIISDSIDKNNVYTLPNNLPGIHAEVRTYNAITTYNPTVSNSQITIATVRGGKETNVGDAFTACSTCSSILPKEVYIPTGTTPLVPKDSNFIPYRREE